MGPVTVAGGHGLRGSVQRGGAIVEGVKTIGFFFVIGHADNMDGLYAGTATTNV